MSYGLTVYNQSNNVIIDSDYRNMVLRQKNTLTFTPTQQSYGNVIVNVDRKSFSLSNAVNPIIFIKSSIGVGLTNITNSGSTYTWTISSNTAGSCTVYIFDLIQSPQTTYGMQVFDASGSVVFNSDNQYMKVIDIFNVPWSSSTWPSVSRSYSSGNYAVSIGCPRTIALIGGSLDTDSIICNSTSVSLSFSVSDITNQVHGYGFLTGSTTLTGLTIDVTGY